MKKSGEGNNRGLIAVLSVLVGLIAVLVVAIVVVRLTGVGNSEDESEKLGDMTTECIYTPEDVTVDCAKLQDDLANIVENSDEEDLRVFASIDLAMLYENDNIDGAIKIIKDELGKGITDQNRYYLLGTLLSLYQDNGDKDGYIEALSEMVKLPD